MYDNRPIGVFDSGVGGLTVLSEIKKLLPRESFVYFADQANNPYGGRKVTEIRKLAFRVVNFLVKKDVKLIIVACNTVSVNAISYIRSKFNVPIIAVVPVVKKLADETKTGKVAVFSTPATAKSRYLKDLIKKYAKNVYVYRVGTSKLEHLVEQGIVSGQAVIDAIESSLLPLIDKKVDCIALGCTHYPFLIPEIKKVVGSKVKIYDSGGAIARQVVRVLEKEGLLSSDKGHDIFYTSGNAQVFKEISGKLLGGKPVDVEKVDSI